VNVAHDSAQHRPLRTNRWRRRTLGGYRYVRLRWRLLFGCIDAVGGLIFALARWLVHPLRRHRSEAEPRRILLVQLDHLGDAILTTGMFGPLKQRFPQAQIDVLAAPWNCDVFASVAEVDRVDVCRHVRFAPGRSLAWIPATVIWGLRLRKRRYDLAIDVRGEFPHNLLVWLSGARRRLGWASGGGGFLLTDKPEFVVNRSETQSRAALLACLGISRAEPLRPLFRPSDAAIETATHAWNEIESASERTRIVLHVGAGTPAKRWPAEHWRRLVEHLAAESEYAVALVGTSADTPTARAILGASTSPDAVDWTGRFGIDELAAVVKQADLLVGADSGPAHLAAAVGTPVVVLFSGTNSPGQWQPCGLRVCTLRSETPCSPCHRKTCPIGEHPCMRRIQPADVIRSLTGLLPERLDAATTGTSSTNTKGSVS